MSRYDPRPKLTQLGLRDTPRFVNGRDKCFMAFPAAGLFAAGSVVQEHHVLLDPLAADVQLIGSEVWIGVAYRQAAQDR